MVSSPAVHEVPLPNVTLKFGVKILTSGPRDRFEDVLRDLPGDQAREFRNLAFAALNRVRSPRKLLRETLIPVAEQHGITPESLKVMRVAEFLGRNGCLERRWGVQEVTKLLDDCSADPAVRHRIMDTILGLKEDWTSVVRWPSLALGLQRVVERSPSSELVERNLKSFGLLVNQGNSVNYLYAFCEEGLHRFLTDFPPAYFACALECCASLAYLPHAMNHFMADSVVPLVRLARGIDDLDAIAKFTRRLSVRPIATWNNSDSGAYLFYGPVAAAAQVLTMDQLRKGFEVIQDFLDTKPQQSGVSVNFDQFLERTLLLAASKGQFERAVSFAKDLFYSPRPGSRSIPSPGFAECLTMDVSVPMREELLSHVLGLESNGGSCPKSYLEYLTNAGLPPRTEEVSKLIGALDELFSKCSPEEVSAVPLFASLSACRNLEERLAIIDGAYRARTWTTVRYPTEVGLPSISNSYSAKEGAYNWIFSWGVSYCLKESDTPAQFASALGSIVGFFDKLRPYPVIFSSEYETQIQEACFAAVHADKAGHPYEVEVLPQLISSWTEHDPHAGECGPDFPTRYAVARRQSVKVSTLKQ